MVSILKYLKWQYRQWLAINKLFRFPFIRSHILVILCSYSSVPLQTMIVLCLFFLSNKMLVIWKTLCSLHPVLNPQVICTFFPSAPSNCGGKVEKMKGSQSVLWARCDRLCQLLALKSCELGTPIIHRESFSKQRNT